MRSGGRSIGTSARAPTRYRRHSSACSDARPLVEQAVAYRYGRCHGRSTFKGDIMRRLVLADLRTACATAAIAEPTPKEQLLVPPADAAHFVIVSTAGKHGDEYRWTT